jgi:hypothetical protein
MEPREGDSEGDHRFQILEVLKSRPSLGKTRIFFTGLHASRPDPGSRWIFFCDVSKKGHVIPYSLLDASPAHLEYLKGLIRFAGDSVNALSHCVRYLEHSVEELSADANTELSRASDKQLRAAARTVRAERVAGWLKDPKIHFHRHNRYALLLGYCGDTRHADVLEHLVADPQKRADMDSDVLLVSYTLLRPKEGWSLVQRLLRDRTEPRRVRASALKAVRFLWDERSDVLPRVDMLRALMPLLDDADLAESLILDLRRWQRWEMTDLLLYRWQKLPAGASSTRHAIVGFALRSPHPKAVGFVDRLRRTAPELLEVAEVILKLEESLTMP